MTRTPPTRPGQAAAASPAAQALRRLACAQSRIETPLGPLTLVASDRGLMAALFDAQAHHPGVLPVQVQPAHPHLALAARELAAYFDAGIAPGAIRFSVPLDAQGTPFQHQVWQQLLGIAPGTLTSYGAIARALGRPAASRAVGAAVGRNPVSIIVPCHRVVGSAGALTGYAGGMHRKQALLQREGAAGGAGAGGEARIDAAQGRGAAPRP